MMRAFTRSFLVFATILIGAELVTRFCLVKTMEGRFDYGYHPTAGFYETQDGQVELQRSGGRRFFPQTFAKQRPNGKYRVMVIGDSVARGKSVAQSYTGQLEKELRAQGVQAECFNLALPGFGSRRKDLVLQQVMNYQPDLVILHVGATNEYEDEREWRRRTDFNSPHPKNWLMRSLVLRQFYEMKTEKLYWQWLPLAVRNQNGGSGDADAELRASADEATQKAWQTQVENVTAQGVQRLQAAGIRTVLVTQATRRKTPQGTYTLDDNAVDAWTTRLLGPTVAKLPMKTVFTPQQATTLYTDSSHVRPEGHTLIAQALAHLLKTQGWLK
ncbi:SGNH/GDSL hydrolase family protein [Prosthecobacter dejongeii]|uniref:SGNH hydrolase-type esterase domain-containing protein n=1 Tax=Prosthecobacter dejongeii TaxID=48465 RepID=A0A7W7YQE4_9BACT|nr:hypothetical protein [Prosthecobacter dejongeii]MBB5040441.1 hypothetical protein [Prosthecobacter dejongeii]